jgi:hypothetical protein
MIRLLAVVLLGVVLMGQRAMATEEPAHTVVLHLGDYPARVVAEVRVTGSQFEAGGSGFRLLAGYIFGGNAGRRHIAMTAPVAQFRSGSDARPEAQSWTVQFFMPNGAALATLPPPNDARVTLVTLPPQRLAVLRYTGWSTAAGFARRSAALLSACADHHLRPVGPVTLAQYNPPWTPWFLRRNEVIVAVAP